MQRSSNPRQAEDAYEAAIEQARRLAAEAPEVPRYRFELSAVLHNHGMFLLRHADRPRAAEGVFRGAERLLAALVEERRGLTIYRRDLANTRLHLGKALVALGKVGDAANSFRLAEAGWRDLFRTYPDEGDHELTLLWVRGEIALLIGNPDEAARLAERMVGHHRADRTSHVIAAGLLARSALASKEKPTREARVGRAIALLRLAIQKGLPQPKDLHRDRDLEALRSHPEFQRLIIERSADQP